MLSRSVLTTFVIVAEEVTIDATETGVSTVEIVDVIALTGISTLVLTECSVQTGLLETLFSSVLCCSFLQEMN